MSFLADNTSTLTRPIPGAVDSIGPGKDMVITFPCGPTYRGVLLELAIGAGVPTRAQIESMLTNFLLQLSGTDIFNLSGTLLLADIEFCRSGLIGDTGYLYIPFEQEHMRTEAGVKGPALGTQGETSMTLRITQDATSTIDGVTAVGIIDPTPAVLGQHIRYRRQSPPLAAAGVTQWPGLYKTRPGLPPEFLYRLHIQVSNAAHLTWLSYIADSVRVFDQATQARLASLYRLPSPARTLQTAKNIITLDFTRGGWDTPVPLSAVEHVLEYSFTNAPTVLNVVSVYGTEEPTQAGAALAAARR